MEGHWETLRKKEREDTVEEEREHTFHYCNGKYLCMYCIYTDGLKDLRKPRRSARQPAAERARERERVRLLVVVSDKCESRTLRPNTAAADLVSRLHTHTQAKRSWAPAQRATESAQGLSVSPDGDDKRGNMKGLVKGASQTDPGSTSAEYCS